MLEPAYDLWCVAPLQIFVVVEDCEVLGSYFIKANGMGPSSHVCNCGYMVSEAARGKGLARKLCVHSQQVAVKLWQKLGFDVVGMLPKAYQHGRLGHVDTYVMYKLLVEY